MKLSDFSISNIAKYYGIAGLEKVGVSDTDILNNITGSTKQVVKTLHDAGWGINRIHTAFETNNNMESRKRIKKYYEWADKKSFKQLSDKLDYVNNEVRSAITNYAPGEEVIIEENDYTILNYLIGETGRVARIIIGENYLYLAEQEINNAKKESAKNYLYNAKNYLSNTFASEKTIKKLLELERILEKQ